MFEACFVAILFSGRRTGFFGFGLFQTALHAFTSALGDEFPFISLVVSRGLAGAGMLGCAAIIQGFFGYAVAFFLVGFFILRHNVAAYCG